eukprot:5427731-Pleurochrysis_carterae.AAC.1
MCEVKLLDSMLYLIVILSLNRSSARRARSAADLGVRAAVRCANVRRDGVTMRDRIWPRQAHKNFSGIISPTWYGVRRLKAARQRAVDLGARAAVRCAGFRVAPRGSARSGQISASP